MRPHHLALSVAFVALGAITLPQVADARDRGAVTVCSDYGNGCYRAPVKRSKWGHKMRLKGGTWIDCRGDCQQTLREETIDFWETQNDKALAIP
jgi:hypothetical protein